MLRKLFFIGLLGLSAVLIITPLTAQDTSTAPVTLNGSAQVIRADIQAMNGVIHVIDAVLVPPQGMTATDEMMATEEMAVTEEMAATEEASGTGEVGAMLDSISATNDALLAEIDATNTAIFGEISGTSTALAGETSMTGTAIQEEIRTTGTAVQAGVQATGTALQNEILGTPAATEDMAATAEDSATEEAGATEEADTSMMTVLEILQSDPELSTSYAAIEAAGLAGTLSGAGPFTLFIPDNAAFETYFAETGTTAEALLADPEALTEVLLYHVVSGQYLASDLAGQSSLVTLGGGDIDLSAGSEDMMSATDEMMTEEMMPTDDMAATEETAATEDAEVTPETTPEG